MDRNTREGDEASPAGLEEIGMRNRVRNLERRNLTWDTVKWAETLDSP